MIARVRITPQPVLGDDLLWGAAAIGRYLKIPIRRVYYMLERGELPVRRFGKKKLVAKKSVLDQWFEPTR